MEMANERTTASPRVAARAPLELIVNVDDLGLHPAVRRAVEACAAIGAVTSASVLANGPDLASVRPVAGVSLGAHLNILRGPPLSPAREVRSLLGADGNFTGSAAALAWRVARGVVRRDEVRLEWSRQVAALRERGLALSHVDGEKHTHCLPGLFAVACEVAADRSRLAAAAQSSAAGAGGAGTTAGAGTVGDAARGVAGPGVLTATTTAASSSATMGGAVATPTAAAQAALRSSAEGSLAGQASGWETAQGCFFG